MGLNHTFLFRGEVSDSLAVSAEVFCAHWHRGFSLVLNRLGVFAIGFTIGLLMFITANVVSYRRRIPNLLWTEFGAG
jgi:hypothetical protein